MSTEQNPAAAPPIDPPAASAPGPGGRWLASVFLALLSGLLFAPTLNYEFVYDDAFLIPNNELMRPVETDLGAAFDFFAREYWEGVNPERPEALRPVGQQLWRPLTLFIWAVIVNLHGLASTWPYHLVSILGNALVVLLLHRLVLALFGRPRLAFVTALLYALHPLHSEAVAYVAGLSDVLTALTVTGGLLLWHTATRCPNRLARKAWLAMLALFFLGMLAKEGGVLLIAAVALTDFALARRGQPRGHRLAVYGGLLAVLAVHLALRVAVLGEIQPDRLKIGLLDNPLVREDFGIRLMNGCKLLAMQVWLFLWPAKLSVDYSFNAIPVARSWADPEVLAGAILVLSMLLYGLLRLRQAPALAWGLLFFLGCATFTANILVPIGTIFGERLTYLPTIGACLAAAAVLDPLLADRRAKGGETAPGAVNPVGLLVVLAAGGALGLRTWERNQDFETSEKLFESALEVSPDSARVHYQLGTLLASQQLFTKAEEHYATALRIDDTFLQAAIGLGDVYNADRNWDKAISTYDQIVKQLKTLGTPAEIANEIYRMVYSRRARAKAGKGDLDAADKDLKQAMALGGTGIGPHLEMANLYIDRERYADALPVLRDALQLNPENTTALYLLARAAIGTADLPAYEQAVAGLERTPAGRPLALAMKAEVMYEQAVEARDGAALEQALELFRQVTALDPKLAAPYIFRGRHLFESGRPYDAIIDFDRALERSPRHPLALLLKAVCLNETDRPEQALATVQELLTVNPNVAAWTAMANAHFLLGDIEGLQADWAKLEELDSDPIEIVLKRCIALEEAGRIGDAIAAVEQGRVVPGYERNPQLLRILGDLLVKAGRHDEALSTFQLQQEALTLAGSGESDPYLPINRFRALLGLDRFDEAAAQLALFEASIQPGTQPWPSLLLRRAELFLDVDAGKYYAPQQALALCREGNELTKNRFPQLLELTIEAHLAAGDVPGAQAAASLAAGQFPLLRRFAISAAALQKAVDGDLAGAREELTRSGDRVLAAIAARLPG